MWVGASYNKSGKLAKITFIAKFSLKSSDICALDTVISSLIPNLFL